MQGKYLSPSMLIVMSTLMLACAATGSTISLAPAPAPVAKPSVTNKTLPTNLKNDEQVLLFPTNAHFDRASRRWIIPVHGWVFEPDSKSHWRKLLVKSLEVLLGVKEHSAESLLFKKRTRMFLVDNKPSKNIVLAVQGRQLPAPVTGANGHFNFTTRLDAAADACAHDLNIQVVTRNNDARLFSGYTQCLQPTGISVISDIDDTIKDSNVLDKRQLLKNTFMQKFKAVAGMSRLYQNWSSNGYRFHYVSSSPWQLYPFIQQFLTEQSFPSGSMHLKLVRLKDKSLFNLFDSPEEGKLPTITKLLTTYPARKFILVGDSGEKDAEIYAQIARNYPDKIIKILIHDIRHDQPRLAKIFQGLPKNKWLVFNDASEILASPMLAEIK